MAYEALEEQYNQGLVPGAHIDPTPVPPESLEQQAAYEERNEVSPSGAAIADMPIGDFVDLVDSEAQFNGMRFALTVEDREAICQVLAFRVISNLEKLANDWREQFIKK